MSSWLAVNARNRGLAQDSLLRLALNQQHSERRPSAITSMPPPSTTSRSVHEMLVDAIDEAQKLRAIKSTFAGPIFQVHLPKDVSCRETPGDLPTKLYAILSNADYDNIVCWMPHGYAWKVKDLNLFVSEILPVFLERGTYPSIFDAFVRLLKSYGFKQITQGPDAAAYYHELFLRGIPHLHGLMRPIPGLARLPLHIPEHEPNFANLRPLPQPTRLTSAILAIPQSPVAPTAVASPVVLNQSFTCRAASMLPRVPESKRHFPLTICPRTPNTESRPSMLYPEASIQELSTLDVLGMSKLRDAQRLHREHLQYLDDAKRLADLDLRPSSSTAPVSPSTKDDAKSILNEDKRKLKKKAARRKWLPPLGPPTPVTPTGGLRNTDWYLTNPEVFAALSEVSLASK